MGRKHSNGKLTDTQWDDIEKRYLTGESARKLSDQYGVSESTIRSRYAGQKDKVKEIATKMVVVNRAFNDLPIASQIATKTLVDELQSINTHLASAAKLGAMTAHRLAGIANMQIDRIDDFEPENSESIMRGMAGLIELSNKSASTGLAVINANKEKLKEADAPLPITKIQRVIVKHDSRADIDNRDCASI